MVRGEMSDNQWSVVSGQWPVVSGQWSVVGGWKSDVRCEM